MTNPVDNHLDIDYLAKDYASFRQLMLHQLGILVPDWTELHPADLGNALVEVLAYAADYLSYFQDAVATEAYLGTARLRRSIQRHTRLLDYRLHEGCNARVWVHVTTDGDRVLLPRGTQLLTQFAQDRLPPVVRPLSAEYVDALAQGPVVFETMHDILLCAEHNQILFHDDPAQLPAGATTAHLRDAFEQDDPSRRLLHHLQAGDVLVFEEIADPRSGRRAGADPKHRHAVRLTQVKPGFARGAAGTPVPIVTVEWALADALPFRLVTSLAQGGDRPRPVSVARGNIVLADHGLTIAHEELPPLTQDVRYRPALRRRGLTHAVPFDPARAQALPAAHAVQQVPAQALPGIQLHELGPDRLTLNPARSRTLSPMMLTGENEGYAVKSWQYTPELLSSGRFSRDFTIEMENDGTAYLRFGHRGVGWEPVVAGARFLATYRVGNGQAGNVGAEAIAHIVTPVGSITGVRNLLPASGGRPPKRLEEARHNAPGAIHVPERCVTEADYAAVAQRHADVAQAIATRHWAGSRSVVAIHVQRRDNRPVDAAFVRALQAHVEPHRLAGQAVEIRPPHYIPLDVALRVTLQHGSSPNLTHQALAAALGSQRQSDGTCGFFCADNFGFGQPVYRSRLIAAAMAVSGVARVEIEQFGRLDGDPQVDPITIGPLEIARLQTEPTTTGGDSLGTLRIAIEATP